MENLGKIKCFLLDMDGTINLGAKLLSGSGDFINYLKESGRDFIFVTNNSSKNGRHYVQKMRNLGIDCSSNNVLTSGEATANYLNSLKPKAKIYLIGTPDLEEEFINWGFTLTAENPDYVVLGFDMTLTYEKLVIGCDLIRKGVTYIATHPDFNCPTETGYIPDCGSMIELIKASTGKLPKIIGKPNDLIIKSAFRKRPQYKLEEFAMVGDRLYTDIKAGVCADITSILVLSGEAAMKDVEESDVKPTFIFDGVATIYQKLKEADETK
ncbi:Hypothetical protein LUCI_2588 [Lucifera butyrica]|uniref:Acid sugar phosphatase n=1 Tax=Lucifera butyrica TaxID=1351585 RepID=A0A498R766_9FIRM|nr:HAD-IIA family hydrolase [Lucifera butyrica]VBB07344.1 Hypothetical protein LUCI_2588 [Lucifera butyrica]